MSFVSKLGNSTLFAALFSNIKKISCLDVSRWNGLQVFVGYFVFTLLVTHTYSPSLLFDHLFTLSDHYLPPFWWKDSAFFTWCYAWWPYAILHRLNPFISNYLFYPEQTNLTGVTSIPTLALVMAPFTLLFGPFFSYNFVSLITPALNGISTFLLAEKIGLSRGGAVLAGAVFAFSPFVVGHLPLHPNLIFVSLLPLGAYVFISWLRQEISEGRFLLLGTLIVTAEAGISLEVLLYGAVATVISFAVYHDCINIRVIKSFLKLGLLCGITLSPFFYYFLIYGHHSGVPANSVPAFGPEGGDLEFVLAPSAAQLLHVPSFVNAVIGAKNPENDLVVGPFLLIALVAGWHHVPLRLLSVMVLFALAALGSPLVYAGFNTGIFNPMVIVHYFPLMAHAIVVRFAVMFWLALALALPQIITKGSKAQKFWVVLALISLLPNPRWSDWIGLHDNISRSVYSPVVPAPFFNHDFRDQLAGKSYIVLPYNGLGGLWQAGSLMSFRAFGDYVGLDDHTPGLAPDSDLIGPLANHGVGTIDLAWAQQLTAYCHRAKVDGILLDPDPWAPMAIVPVLRQAGWQETTNDHLIILTPPPAA